jgi:hypothetical protein
VKATPLLLVLLLVGWSGGAPGPKTEPYFPSKVGTRWILGVNGGGLGDDAEETFVVVAVENSPKGKLVTVGVEREKVVVPQRKVLVSATEVTEVEFGGQTLDPPDCLLQRTDKETPSWDKEEKIGTGRLRTTRTCRGPEVVEVPAGKFTALRVDEERFVPRGKSEKMTCWYARDVGLVKMERDGEVVIYLKSFEAAK